MFVSGAAGATSRFFLAIIFPMVEPPIQRRSNRKKPTKTKTEDLEPALGRTSDAVAQRTSGSKKRSRKLGADAAPLAHNPPSVIHFQELSEIWEGDRRIPTLSSRRAWSLARNINPANVNNWWYRRKAVARKRKLTIPDGTYDLPIGTPPDLSVKAEVKEEPYGGTLLKAKKSRKKVQTHTATVVPSSGEDLERERASIPSSDLVTLVSASTETTLFTFPQELPSISPHDPSSDSLSTRRKRAYTQCLSPCKTILDDASVVPFPKKSYLFSASHGLGGSSPLPGSAPGPSDGTSPSVSHDAPPNLNVRTLTLRPSSLEIAFPESGNVNTQEAFPCSTSIRDNDLFPTRSEIHFPTASNRALLPTPSLQTLFPSYAPMCLSSDSTDGSNLLGSAHECSPCSFICLEGSHFSPDGFALLDTPDEFSNCTCFSPHPPQAI